MHKSFGSRRNYRVLKLGNMPKATVDIQPSDFRFGWGRNYMVLKLVLLPIHSFWWRKKLHGTQTSQLLVPEGDPGWKKIELQDTQTSSAEALVWTRKKLHGTQTRRVDYRVRRR